MDDTDQRHDTYVIVGAGVFGTSVALHLIRKYPFADVILVDRGPFPYEAGASWDWNKVIRADYTTPMYMELALEAMCLWRDDSLYKPFYHESGLVWVDNKGLPWTIIDNYKRLGAPVRCRLSSPKEAKKLWDGIHAGADYRNVTDILINENSGWADATDALTEVISVAVAAGVKYVAADVKEIVFDTEGATTGVKTADGAVLSARHVILATGAYTPRLLMDSAPERNEMHLGGRLVAAGICEASVLLNEKDAKYFRQGPVFVHEVGDTLGGAIPPNSENRIKLYRDVSFTNIVFHDVSGKPLSVPPGHTDYDQWTLSPKMKFELELTCKGIFGWRGKGWELTDHRICWDAITPTQDPIICEHPHSKNLYIVTGGSFHSWKFLPIIGKYAIQMIEGTLDPKLAEAWAWDREDKGSAHGGLLPKRDMKDM